MRILFLTPQLPFPPRQGTALRNWGLISHLAGRHEIWLLSFDERPGAGERPLLPAELRAACAQVATLPVPRRGVAGRLARLAASPLPDMAWRLWSPAFAARLGAWLDQRAFDVLQVEGIELARYLPAAAGRRPGPAIVFDDHNCEYVLQRRAYETDARRPARWHAAAYSAVQWRRLRRFEQRAMQAAQATLCVSEQDAAALRLLDPAARLEVVVNGIDVASYWPSAEQGGDPPTMVFTGKMDFRPNVDAVLWFAGQILPLVRAQAPGARLLVVGQRPSPRLDPLRADPGIVLTGEVDDARPYIAQADVYVAPLLAGGGTRFKLLEAMALQRAVVSTRLGCEGFDVRSGGELEIADTPADFARSTIALLRDPARRAALGARARAFVAARYDWSAIVPRLERVYEEITRR